MSASPPRRSWRRAPAAAPAAAPGAPPRPLTVVSLRALLTDGGAHRQSLYGRPRYPAADALLQDGCFVVTLPPSDAAALSELLLASGELFAPGKSYATQLAGNKALVEYRRGLIPLLQAAGLLPPQHSNLFTSAESAYASLAAAGRATLEALSASQYVAHDVVYPLAEPLGQLSSLLEADPPTAGAPAVSSSVLTFLQYGAGAEAVPHTDRGLLTFVYAAQEGLQVRLRGSEEWTPAPAEAHMILVFAGEALQVATGNAVRACVHRVVPGAQQRRSVVLRLRGDPAAAIPLTYGPYFGCRTLGGMEAMFQATHASVNVPAVALPAPPAAQAPPAAVVVNRLPKSPAEAVLSSADLVDLIVRLLADNARALATAERVCRALHAAASQHWRPLCLRMLSQCRDPHLPRCIPADDGAQWRMLYRCLRTPIEFNIKDMDTPLWFKTRMLTRLGVVFQAYCARKRVDMANMRFLLNGQPLSFRETTPWELRLEKGDSVDALAAQVGD